MKNVLILLSSFNGETYIEKQIRSIMNQKDVQVFLIIRDDGSKDHTVEVVQKLQCEYGNERIRLIQGKNLNWRKSFLELLMYKGNCDYDYIGFADQDDVWIADKIKKSIEVMEQDDYQGIKLVHVNSTCVDANMNVREEQERKYAIPRSKKAVIAQEYFQGCSMLWNQEAMRLLQSYCPEADLPHDYWVGVVCTWFGKIYFCEEPLFYHIRYGQNSSADGNVVRGRLDRMKKAIKGTGIYFNPAMDLLQGFGKYLVASEIDFLQCICRAKNNWKYRIKLVLDKEFSRESLLGNLFFKWTIFRGLF